MHIIHMSAEILFTANHMLPVMLLPNTAFAIFHAIHRTPLDFR